MEPNQVNVAVIAGVILSLVFEYVPGAATWYEMLDKRGKQGIMALALLLVCGAYFAFGCLGLFGVQVSCDWIGAEEVIKMFVLALVTNQSTYLIARKD